MSLDTQIAHFWNLCNDCSDSYEIATKVAKQHILSSNERCEAVLCLAGCLVEMDGISQSASGESTNNVCTGTNSCQCTNHMNETLKKIAKNLNCAMAANGMEGAQGQGSYEIFNSARPIMWRYSIVC